MIKLPRLLDSNGVFVRTIRPQKATVELNITPLSTASLQLPENETLPARSFVEMYTILGSAGIYRVRSPENSYGEDISVAELEHAVVEVGDYLVREKISEMMAAQTAITTLFSHYRGSKWKLGSLSALGSGQVAVQANYEPVLQCLLDVLDQIPTVMLAFDFSTSPWTINFVPKGTVVEAEGRLSRNVESARITYDDSELCTRAYYEVDDEDGATWASVDADTISEYGVVEREAPTGAGYTQEESLRAAQEYLRKHKRPRVSIEINGEVLSHITGEPLDTFAIGKLFRLALAKYNITVEQTITGLVFEDVYGAPRDVSVALADEEDTAVTFLHDMSTGNGGGGGGGRSAKKQSDVSKGFYIDYVKSQKTLDIFGKKIGEADSILFQTGLYLDETGTLVYATDHENNIGSKLKVESDKIALVVEGFGDNAHIKPASIVAAINEGSSSIKISADHIVLDGDAVASSLESKDMFVNSLTANDLEATDGLTCLGDMTVFGDVDCANLLISDISVSGNVLTIFKTDGTQLSFSKATTLNGAWSGGTYTVTASPQGNQRSTTLYQLTPTGNVSVSGSNVTQNVRVDYANSTGDGGISTGFTFPVTISASNVANTINMPTAQIYTTSGSPPSGSTNASTLKTRVQQAIADGDTVVFRIDCGGSQKYYHMSF